MKTNNTIWIQPTAIASNFSLPFSSSLSCPIHFQYIEEYELAIWKSEAKIPGN